MIKINTSAKTIGDQIEQMVFNATVEKLRGLIEERVAPFREEVNAMNGTVTITISGSSIKDLKANLTVSNIDKDLKMRIMETINN